jgi:glycerol-3-phosphate acyltransferase PlsY
MGTWLLVAFVFRYSSLAALSASLLAPAYYLMGDQRVWNTSEAELLAVMVMSALLLIRHKDNIVRLVSGQESKIGAKKEAAAEPESEKSAD